MLYPEAMSSVDKGDLKGALAECSHLGFMEQLGYPLCKYEVLCRAVERGEIPISAFFLFILCVFPGFSIF